MGENPKQSHDQKEMSFWDHLDDLRWTLFRIAIGIVVCMIVVFVNKGIVFDGILLAPTTSDFIVYKLMCRLAEAVSMPSLCPETFKIQLINTTVSGQFFIHISTSFWLGLLLAFPWVIYQLWIFISPALYQHERKATTRAFAFGSVLFFLGVFIGYILIFPLALRFLGEHFVSNSPDAVPNMINLASYIDVLVTLTLSMGLVFEMPILLYLLSRIGIINKKFLRKYRRHAIVIILVVAAIITPTPDPFTLIVVSIPIILLYEFSIWICRDSKKEESSSSLVPVK
jgi:sec-independent protein translocase protein TatC